MTRGEGIVSDIMGGEVPDRDLFPCPQNPGWQRQRARTFFWSLMAEHLPNLDIDGLRRVFVRHVKEMSDDSAVQVEFVNCLTHCADCVQNALLRRFLNKGYNEPTAIKKAQEHPSNRAMAHILSESHWFFRHLNDKRAWHARLEKWEKWA